MLRKQAQIAEKLRPGRGSIVGFRSRDGGFAPGPPAERRVLRVEVR